MSLLAFTLLVANYWVIKYGQQAKQYGTDFLLSALMLLLLATFVQQGMAGKYLLAPLLATAVGTLLSYTAVFWIPAVLAFALISKPSANSPVRTSQRWLLPAAASGLLGSSFLAVYFIFVRPNRTPALIANFMPNYFDFSNPAVSIWRLASTVGALLAPVPRQINPLIGVAALLMAVYAGISAIRELQRGHQRGPVVLIAGGVPLLSVLVAGMLRLYPVLVYTRLLMFCLPPLALILGYCAESIVGRSAVVSGSGFLKAATIACFFGVTASQWIYFRYPRDNEENRPAITFIQSHLQKADLLVVHGAMYEQLKYYRRQLGFFPLRTYIMNGWGCCATGDKQLRSSPHLDYAGDLLEAARQSKPAHLWLLLPSAAPGHWTAGFRHRIEMNPTILQQVGCTREQHRVYEQTLVESYSCP
jgi:predicted branched-subunit amino acid permease